MEKPCFSAAQICPTGCCSPTARARGCVTLNRNRAESHGQPQTRTRMLHPDPNAPPPAPAAGSRWRRRRLAPEPNLGKGGKLSGKRKMEVIKTWLDLLPLERTVGNMIIFKAEQDQKWWDLQEFYQRSGKITRTIVKPFPKLLLILLNSVYSKQWLQIF